MSEVLALKTARSGTKLRIGFLRLTDSAPAIVAQEFGYFAEEGVDAELLEEPSWANIADKLAYGFLDAAVIVPPLAFAIALGSRGISQKLIIPCNISMGGNTITLARDLAMRVRETAAKDRISTPMALAACLAGREQPLALGVVHAFSTHNLLLRYWLATAGLQAGRDVRLSVVPPARAVEALQSGQIAGFCAGAPWGEIAARAGAGTTIATSDDIWRNAPEKAFAVRARWAEENPEGAERRDPRFGPRRAILRRAGKRLLYRRVAVAAEISGRRQSRDPVVLARRRDRGKQSFPLLAGRGHLPLAQPCPVVPAADGALGSDRGAGPGGAGGPGLSLRSLPCRRCSHGPQCAAGRHQKRRRA